MSGLREKKKARTRAAILDAARTLFTEKGYAGTTTAAIAERADIAEGTVFNYFASKAEILVAIFYDAFASAPFDFAPSPDATLEERIAQFVDAALRPARQMDKSLLREVLSIGYRYTNEGSYVFEQMQAMDQQIMAGLTAHVEALKSERALPHDLDVEALLEVGYATVMYQFGRYAMEESTSYAEMMRRIRRNVAVLARGANASPRSRKTKR